MRAGDVAGRHCDRDLGWYVGDRREVGDLAQHPAGYHAGAARRVGADQHAIERVARAHGPHELEDHARIPRATDLERAPGLGDEALDLFLRHRNRAAGGVTHDIGLDAFHDVDAGDLAHPGARDAARVDLDLDPSRA